MKLKRLCRSVVMLFTLMTAKSTLAQSNKVGIGTNAPHPNAILHLESPNSNQGLMLTRLTPGQMNAGAMVNNLGMTEKGLVVYDSVRNGMYMWDGNRWKPSWAIRFPYADSLENGPGGTNMIGLKYKSNTGVSVGIMYLENQDQQNAFAPLFALTNSANGAAANFISSNATNNANTISATNSGLGRAGRFQVNNVNHNGPAVIVTSNGGTNSVGLFAENTGSGASLVGISNGNGPASSAVYGEHKGTGSAAGVFIISNASSGSPAIFAQTNGTGNAMWATASGSSNGLYATTSGSGNTVFAVQTGTGRALQVQINNTSNAESAIRGFTDGLGRAGFFTVNNPANTAAALFATHNGNGSSIQAENTGNSNAFYLSSGGMRLAVTGLNSGTNVSTRSPVYDITGGGPYTTSFPLTNGELFLFYNRTAGTVSVNGISIPAGTGITTIVLGGQLRAL